MTDPKDSYWNDGSDIYQYPNSTILKNIPGVTDAAELEALELNATVVRLPEAMSAMQDKPITLKLWQEIHHILFQDIYEWSGVFRTVQMSKGNTLFAHPENIESEGKRVFDELSRENFLQGLALNDLCRRLAYYFSECNALHPFREGNGRTQKLLFGEILKRLGYRIDWKKLSVEEHLKAMVEAHNQRPEQLIGGFLRILSKEI
ncbi:MAG: cell filamentation protein Fic [Candidatus Nitrohelix vancouverensis]|uniref:protein adenylyltransferase n=1 Tax=Candidatus Nitrohelix vancouverensis TaxID=2705534 RepID=A0A7T0C0W9_9BACT|nr:MAG: cell filamentation protein Fic [Candidatus Nitrohelix vancouverensis]